MLIARNLTHDLQWRLQSLHVLRVNDLSGNQTNSSTKSVIGKEHLQRSHRPRHYPTSLLLGSPHLIGEEDGNLAAVTRPHQHCQHIAEPEDMMTCFPSKSANWRQSFAMRLPWIRLVTELCGRPMCATQTNALLYSATNSEQLLHFPPSYPGRPTMVYVAYIVVSMPSPWGTSLRLYDMKSRSEHERFGCPLPWLVAYQPHKPNNWY